MVRLVKIPKFEDMCDTLMVLSMVIIYTNVLTNHQSFRMNVANKYIVLKVPDATLIFFFFHVNLKPRFYNVTHTCIFIVTKNIIICNNVSFTTSLCVIFFVHKWFCSKELGFHGPLDICHVYHSQVHIPCH